MPACTTDSVFVKYICCHSTNMQLISDDGFTQKQTFHAAVTDVALLLFKGAGQGCKGLGR